MRIIVLSGILLTIFSVNLIAVPTPVGPKPASEPTEEQLNAAKKGMQGVETKDMKKRTDLATKEVFHLFHNAKRTTDAFLKGIPHLPFQFALYFQSTNVTDAGLKEIKEYKKPYVSRPWINAR